MITNWQGHGTLGQTQDIAEVTPDKKVVWTFSDHAQHENRLEHLHHGRRRAALGE